MGSDARAREVDPLLQHAEWVRALARALVRDGSAADDLAQETWLAALRDRRGTGASARRWLAAVVTNTARQLARSEARRALRERAAARPEATATDVELHERVALQQWVVGQVMALDEPYRRVVLLRYFEGMPPRSIAARTGVPLETVKSRLRRALQRLRERMSAERGPGGARGVLALVPLVSHQPGGAAAGAGVLLVQKKSVALVAGIALLMAGALWFGALAPEGAPSDLAFIRPHRELDGSERTRAETIASSTANELDPAQPEADVREPAALPSATCRIRTVEGESGRLLAGDDVWILSRELDRELRGDDGRGESYDVEAVAREHGRKFRSDDRGELTFAVPREPCLAAGRRDERFGILGSLPEAGCGAELALLVDRTLVIRAAGEDGEPLAGYPVGIATGDPPETRWWARTDAERGEVTLHHAAQQLAAYRAEGVLWEVTAAAPWPHPPRVAVDPNALPTSPVLLVASRGARVVIRLEGARGELLEDTWVYVVPVAPERDRLGRSIRPSRTSRFTHDGIAVFDDVAPGIELDVSAAPSGWRSVERGVESPRAAGEELLVPLRFEERLPILRGTLVDAAGNPVADRHMELRARATSGATDRAAITGRLETDGDGTFGTSVWTNAVEDVLAELELATDESYEGGALAARIHVPPPPSRASTSSAGSRSLRLP